MKNILCLCIELGTFVHLVYFLCVPKHAYCFCMVIHRIFLVWSKYAEIYIAINYWTAEPGCWSDYVSYILATNASLLLSKEPWTAMMIFYVMYAIPLLNSRQVRLITLCWFHDTICIMWRLLSKNQCRQSSSYKIVFWLHMPEKHGAHFDWVWHYWNLYGIDAETWCFNDESLWLRTNQIYWWHFCWPSHHMFFSCDQAAIWLVQSVCLSVRPSVTPFSPCSHHRIIMKFSGVITNDKNDVHAKGQGQRSKVKVTEVNTQLNCFRTVTPDWIHIW